MTKFVIEWVMDSVDRSELIEAETEAQARAMAQKRLTDAIVENSWCQARKADSDDLADPQPIGGGR